MKQNIVDRIKYVRYHYPDITKFSDKIAVMEHNVLLKESIILEFLDRTISINKTISELKNRYKQKFNNVFILKENDKVDNGIIIEFKKNDFYNIVDILKFMDSFGWFPATINDDKYVDDVLPSYFINSEIELSFEAKYDKEIELDQDYIYHVCPDVRFSDIKQYGLHPKSKSKLTTHPERIYFFLNKTDAEWLVEQLYSKENPKIKNMIEKYYLLKIDYSSLKGKVQLFNDVNFPKQGVYTTSLISPIYITIEKEITI